MKTLLLVLLLLLSCTLPAQAWAAGKSVHVRGYTRKDGTSVAPYVRSSPRSTYRGYSMPAAAFAGMAFASHAAPPNRPDNDGSHVGQHPRQTVGLSLSGSTGYRTAYRTSTREGVATGPTKPSRQFPVRDWHAEDGRLVGHGRMKSRAGDVLRIESVDGRHSDLKVSSLHPDDVQWLESARRDPNGMKTDILPNEADVMEENGGSARP